MLSAVLAVALAAMIIAPADVRSPARSSLLASLSLAILILQDAISVSGYRLLAHGPSSRPCTRSTPTASPSGPEVRAVFSSYHAYPPFCPSCVRIAHRSR